MHSTRKKKLLKKQLRTQKVKEFELWQSGKDIERNASTINFEIYTCNCRIINSSIKNIWQSGFCHRHMNTSNGNSTESDIC